MDKKLIIKEYLLMTLGCFLIAAAVCFFMVPGELVFGSVSGLSQILIQVIPMKISFMNLILNIFFLVLGFIFIGKGFGVRSVFTAVVIPAWMYVLEITFPVSTSLTNEKWMDMLCCILLVSAGQTLLFQVNASSGGLDIPAKILNKYFGLEIGRGVAVVGIATVLSSLFVYDITTTIYGIVGTYLNGRVVDDFIGGFTRKKKACILSDKAEEIQQFIQKDINRGVTLYKAIGGYSKQERTEVVSILAQSEYLKLIRFVREVDPSAFVTVTSINEVVGIWNQRGKAYRL